MSTIQENINPERIPKHVAIIMDGNGRWAQKKGMERTFGHQNAIKAVKSAIEACGDLNIPYLTLYAFSSENWSRPKLEVNFLMNLLSKSLKKELHSLQENQISLKIIGDINNLPNNIKNELNKVVELTKNNQKAQLILALSYGAKNEIVRAAQKIIADAKANQLQAEDLTEETFKSYLYTKDVPDVDLMIRTSGEWRISNFLLWQIAYAELYFTDVLWPDFRKEDFFKAIVNYQQRERRFGKTSTQINTQ